MVILRTLPTLPLPQELNHFHEAMLAKSFGGGMQKLWATFCTGTHKAEPTASVTSKGYFKVRMAGFLAALRSESSVS